MIEIRRPVDDDRIETALPQQSGERKSADTGADDKYSHDKPRIPRRAAGNSSLGLN